MATIRCMLMAVAGAVVAAPAFAKDKPAAPLANLAIEPIIASDLLSTARPASHKLRLSLIDAERAGLVAPPPYRLDREGDSVTGKRAKLSIAVGDTRLFALSGKLSRRARPATREPIEQANVLAPRKLDGGRLYGAGVERRIGPAEVTASYQFSRISSGQPELGDDRAKSHSLHLRARLRF